MLSNHLHEHPESAPLHRLALFVSLRSPNFSQPWQMMQQTKSIASGFVVAPLSARRILTNAHAVANQVQVMLRKHGNAKKFPAKVLAVGHECDIAMLTVENDEVRRYEAYDIHVASFSPYYRRTVRHYASDMDGSVLRVRCRRTPVMQS